MLCDRETYNENKSCKHFDKSPKEKWTGKINNKNRGKPFRRHIQKKKEHNGLSDVAEIW